MCIKQALGTTATTSSCAGQLFAHDSYIVNWQAQEQLYIADQAQSNPPAFLHVVEDGQNQPFMSITSSSPTPTPPANPPMSTLDSAHQQGQSPAPVPNTSSWLHVYDILQNANNSSALALEALLNDTTPSLVDQHLPPAHAPEPHDVMNYTSMLLDNNLYSDMPCGPPAYPLHAAPAHVVPHQLEAVPVLPVLQHQALAPAAAAAAAAAATAAPHDAVIQDERVRRIVESGGDLPGPLHQLDCSLVHALTSYYRSFHPCPRQNCRNPTRTTFRYFNNATKPSLHLQPVYHCYGCARRFTLNGRLRSAPYVKRAPRHPHSQVDEADVIIAGQVQQQQPATYSTKAARYNSLGTKRPGNQACADSIKTVVSRFFDNHAHLDQICPGGLPSQHSVLLSPAPAASSSSLESDDPGDLPLHSCDEDDIQAWWTQSTCMDDEEADEEIQNCLAGI